MEEWKTYSLFHSSTLHIGDALKLLAFFFLAFTACGPNALAAGRPNFVIMMTDDQRHDAMGIAGNRMLKTPNLDRIGREGIRFRNMFVINALCAPSRATLLTGLYSHSHGVIDNRDRALKPEQPILADLMREAGYEVTFCGKSHVNGALRDRKWDYYFGYRGQGRYMNPVIAEGVDGTDKAYPGYMDDVVTDKAVDWLKRKREKPFCLFLFFKAPHRSWERAPRHAELFKDDVVPKPSGWDEFDKGYPGKPRAFADADNKIGNAPDVMSLEKMVKDINATVTAVDENVGKVFAALEVTGRLKDTAMLFTSDNGFFHGEWRLYDKRLMHEPSIRVPLLIRYPDGIKSGLVKDQMALNVDIAPTILDMARIPVPNWMHGRSLLPILSGKRTAWRKDWLYEYFEYPDSHKVKPHRGIRTDRWKLIHYYETPEEFELYDLRKDSGELNNLYGGPDSAQVTAQLKRRLETLRRETGDLPG